MRNLTFNHEILIALSKHHGLRNCGIRDELKAQLYRSSKQPRTDRDIVPRISRGLKKLVEEGHVKVVGGTEHRKIYGLTTKGKKLAKILTKVTLLKYLFDNIDDTQLFELLDTFFMRFIGLYHRKKNDSKLDGVAERKKLLHEIQQSILAEFEKKIDELES